MFIRLLFLYIIIFVGLFFYISYLNPLDIKFQYIRGGYLETSLSTLLVSCLFIGVFVTFLIYLIRDIGKSIKEHKKRKENEKLREMFYQATDALFRNDLPKAEKQILAYLKKRPDDPKAYIKLAEVYHKGERSQEAVEAIKKAKNLKRDQLEVLHTEAQIYKEIQDYPGAIQAFREIIALSPDSLQAMAELRDIYIKEEEWEEALEIQRRIMKTGSKKDDKKIEREKKLHQCLKYEYAKYLTEKGKKKKGIKELKEIIREAPSFIPPYVLLGELLSQSGDSKSAIRIWQRGFVRTREIIFLQKLEDLYLAHEDPRSILHLYLEAMEKNPDNIVIPFFYAQLCLRLEMIDEALERLREMESTFSDHSSYHYLLAEVYFHQGDYDQAAEEYRTGLRLEGGAQAPYRCTNCQEEVKHWIPLCPECGQWGTFTAFTQETIKMPLSPPPAQLMAWDF